ncbi:10774_t:CDS:2 [Acaulospora morrowiae]|uniref:10774_t:CDS:1 n=1 Tax=Acaulospora morrowiae TaxID=94023 RepID=A0A9N8WKD1_9GLOM|nr:10774_t:CDS:2 [Acaulospora morrowiae]
MESNSTKAEVKANSQEIIVKDSPCFNKVSCLIKEEYKLNEDPKDEMLSTSCPGGTVKPAHIRKAITEFLGEKSTNGHKKSTKRDITISGCGHRLLSFPANLQLMNGTSEVKDNLVIEIRGGRNALVIDEGDQDQGGYDFIWHNRKSSFFRLIQLHTGEVIMQLKQAGDYAIGDIDDLR